MQEAVDKVTCDGVTVSPRAPGAQHPECGSISEIAGLIRQPNEVRRRPGRVWPKAPSVAVLSPGQAGPRWYVASVERRAARVRAGETVAEALERALGEGGWAGVVPRYRTSDDVLAWAFPGYMLVELDRRDPRWRSVPHVPGVRRLIGPDAERPMPVADVQAAWVLGQFGPDGYQRRPINSVAAPPLPLAARVKVIGGLGLGWHGEVVESDGLSVVILVGNRRVRMAQAAVQLIA